MLDMTLRHPYRAAHQCILLAILLLLAVTLFSCSQSAHAGDDVECLNAALDTLKNAQASHYRSTVTTSVSLGNGETEQMQQITTGWYIKRDGHTDWYTSTTVSDSLSYEQLYIGEVFYTRISNDGVSDHWTSHSGQTIPDFTSLPMLHTPLDTKSFSVSEQAEDGFTLTRSEDSLRSLQEAAVASAQEQLQALMDTLSSADYPLETIDGMLDAQIASIDAARQTVNLAQTITVLFDSRNTNTLSSLYIKNEFQQPKPYPAEDGTWTLSAPADCITETLWERLNADNDQIAEQIDAVYLQIK